MQSPSSCVEELPRIAQLQDEIEKRDKELLRSKKENEALKVMIVTLVWSEYMIISAVLAM